MAWHHRLPSSPRLRLPDSPQAPATCLQVNLEKVPRLSRRLGRAGKRGGRAWSTWLSGQACDLNSLHLGDSPSAHCGCQPLSGHLDIQGWGDLLDHPEVAGGFPGCQALNRVGGAPGPVFTRVAHP